MLLVRLFVEKILFKITFCAASLLVFTLSAHAQTSSQEVERMLSDWPPVEGHRPIPQTQNFSQNQEAASNSFNQAPVQQPYFVPNQPQIAANNFAAPAYIPPQNNQQNYQQDPSQFGAPNYSQQNYPPLARNYAQAAPFYQPPSPQNSESFSPAPSDIKKQRQYDSRGARMAIFDRQESLLDAMKISFGAGLGYFPEFPGSGKNKYMPLPVIDVRYRDTFFLNTFRGAGYNLFNTYDFKAGPMLTFDFGRDSSDASYLNGFADIDPTVESGFFLEKRFTPNFGVSWDIRNDSLSRGHEGVVSNLSLEGDWQMNDQLMLSSSLGTSWASENYMENYFGVSNSQSAASGLSYYGVSSGFKDIGADVGARFVLSEKISLAGTLGFKRLIGDAADSPIVKHGDANQYTGGAYAVYSF